MKSENLNVKKGEIVIYKAKGGAVRLDVMLEKETVWLNQSQMAKLFNKDVRTISEHIQNAFKEHELERKSTIRNFRITAADGKSYPISKPLAPSPKL